MTTLARRSRGRSAQAELVEEYDAILADVAHTLTKPDEYVRRVVENHYLYAFDRRRAVTRLGATPNNVIPNYRIEEPGVAPIDGSTSKASNRPKRNVFNGRTHEKITEELAMAKTWSTRSTTFEEISELLGQLRQALK